MEEAALEKTRMDKKKEKETEMKAAWDSTGEAGFHAAFLAFCHLGTVQTNLEFRGMENLSAPCGGTSPLGGAVGEAD